MANEINFNNFIPPPPAGRKNVVWQQDNLGNVSAYAGSGSGSTTFETLVGAEPSAVSDGDLDFYTNGQVVTRFNATPVTSNPTDNPGGLQNWHHWGPIFKFIRPKLSDFTFLNQGGASADILHNGIHLVAPKNSGLNLRCLVQPLSASIIAATGGLGFLVSHNNQHYEDVFDIAAGDFLIPDQVGFFVDEESGLYQTQTSFLHWSVASLAASGGGDPSVGSLTTGSGVMTVGLIGMFWGVDVQASGIFLRNSSSGKIVSLQQTATAAGLVLEIIKYDSVTSKNSSYLSQLILNPFKFLRITVSAPKTDDFAVLGGTVEGQD